MSSGALPGASLTKEPGVPLVVVVVVVGACSSVHCRAFARFELIRSVTYVR